MNPIQLMEQSATTSDRQLVRSLVTLAKQKYVLKENFYLTNNLSYFLFNACEKIPMTYVYPVSSIEIMEKLFKTEVDFSKEAILYIEKYLNRPLKENDYLVLAESVIAANYQLDINKHEQEKFIHLIHCLLTQIAFCVSLPRTHLFTEEPRLMRHIKFLTLRILKGELDFSESNNELYFYVIEHHSREFHSANQIRVFITENFDFDLSNDEISYLALHFRELRRRYGDKNQLQ